MRPRCSCVERVPAQRRTRSPSLAAVENVDEVSFLFSGDRIAGAWGIEETSLALSAKTKPGVGREGPDVCSAHTSPE